MSTPTPNRRPRRAGLLAALAAALFCALPAQADGPRPATRSATTAQASASKAGVVNLNQATETELTRLPGIGPSRAQAIIALRDRMKRFKRIEDIMRVKGIGRRTFRKLRPMLALEGPTTLLSPVKASKK
ncbi:MAG: helix-hairpin-helix domain-containing protein [Myxococcales bacterium]|nr:helix-hairpin-helix domain-containing protein [Myxococcales bacterium]